MNSVGLMARLDDRLNPIVVKELRQAVQSKIVLAALGVYLLLQVTILFLILSFNEPKVANGGDLYAGRVIFLTLQGILVGTCLLLIPAYAGVRLAAERSDTNVDLLFISTLRPRAIIAGKFQGALVLILLIFSTCAPFMTFTYLMRGIDIPTILVVLGLDFLAVLLGTQLALFLGSIPAHWGAKVLLGLLGLGCLGGLFGLAMFCSVVLVEEGLGVALDSKEFWLFASGVVTVVVAVIGLLFAWSVAMVSPPSGNRALPVRLFLAGAWLVTGAVAALLAYQFPSPWPIYLWVVLQVGLCSLQVLTAINEREQWGVRVARTIPRPWWLRGPAFLFYSGSAGGVLLAVLLLALTFGLAAFLLDHWQRLSPHRFEAIRTELFLLVMVLLALYMLAYGLSAVWVRLVLLHGKLRPIFTWVVALILAALGWAMPHIVLFVFFNEQQRFGDISPWATITDPASTTYTFATEFRPRPSRFPPGAPPPDPELGYGALWFAGSWAVLMVLLCLPWMVRQMRRFHPPERAPERG